MLRTGILPLEFAGMSEVLTTWCAARRAGGESLSKLGLEVLILLLGPAALVLVVLQLCFQPVYGGQQLVVDWVLYRPSVVGYIKLGCYIRWASHLLVATEPLDRLELCGACLAKNHRGNCNPEFERSPALGERSIVGVGNGSSCG